MIKLNKNILLASKSPRRKELLSQLGIAFSVVEIDFDEEKDSNIKPQNTALYLAESKSKQYGEIHSEDLLITSDTTVIFNNQLLGKPISEDEAIKTLTKLSCNMHEVVSAYCIRTSKKTICNYDVTKVYFKKLSALEIEYYVKNFQPLDKAGSYGIQEWIGMIGIEKIEGSFYTVMGLPVHKLYSDLKLFL